MAIQRMSDTNNEFPFQQRLSFQHTCVLYTHMHNTRDIQTAYKILEFCKPDEPGTQRRK